MSSGVHKTFDKKRKQQILRTIYMFIQEAYTKPRNWGLKRSFFKENQVFMFIIDICTLSLALSLKKKIKLPEQRGKR